MDDVVAVLPAVLAMVGLVAGAALFIALPILAVGRFTSARGRRALESLATRISGAASDPSFRSAAADPGTAIVEPDPTARGPAWRLSRLRARIGGYTLTVTPDTYSRRSLGMRFELTAPSPSRPDVFAPSPSDHDRGRWTRAISVDAARRRAVFVTDIELADAWTGLRVAADALRALEDRP